MILSYLSCNKLAQVVIVRYDIKSLGMALLQEYRLHVPFWDTKTSSPKSTTTVFPLEKTISIQQFSDVMDVHVRH